MATHCNFSCIVPQADGTYSVVIARGVEATGDPRTVEFDTIANEQSLESAAMIARSAPNIPALEFWRYSKNTR